MNDQDARRRIFSLAEAHTLLPTVKTLTADAARTAEELASAIEALSADDPDCADERARLGTELNRIVTRWVGQMHELGLETKGLWLVDFDNGEGYYCWKHPEDQVQHFHGYREGFAGRMRIM